jgi:GNAT superfamily N-acetyltransferase
MSALPPGYAIRRARASDAALLPAIERAAAAQFRTQGLEGPWIDTSYDVEDYARAEREGWLWVAEHGDAPVGFAMAFALGGGFHLEEIDVHPAHGRRGLGAALVRTVQGEARRGGFARVTLRTFRDVPWNAPFYARLGFRALAPEETPAAVAELAKREEEQGIPLARRVAMACELDALQREAGAGS